MNNAVDNESESAVDKTSGKFSSSSVSYDASQQ